MTVDAPVRNTRREKQSDRAKHDRNPELRNAGIVVYPGEPIGDNPMVQQQQDSEYPSAFAISVVFGGAVGMAAFPALGLPAGGGFFVGFSCVFLVFFGIALSNNFEDRRR